MKKYIFLLVFIAGISSAACAMSTPPSTTTSNSPYSTQWTPIKQISSSNTYNTSPVIATDGAGGAFISWFNGNNSYIYAQRISGSGTSLWSSQAQVANVSTFNTSPSIASDGAGGAFITWYSGNNSYIYAQRINSSGTLLWTSSKQIASANTENSSPSIVSDGAGGAFITWYNGNNTNIYAQRINSSGSLIWSSAVLVADVNTEYSSPSIASDGAGGAFITWYNGNNTNIYAQRINSSGTLLWSSQKLIADGNTENSSPAIAPDGSGGAFITWYDGNNSYIGAQRIDGSGTLLFSSLVQVASANTNNTSPAISYDGVGGALITWYSETDGSLYTQRMNSTGTLLWSSPLLIGAADTYNTPPATIPDGINGIFITWYEGDSYTVDVQRLTEYFSSVYMSPTGNDNYGDGSSSFPYATIQQSLNKVATGGAISVAAGTYKGTGNIGVNWPAKDNLSLIGSGPYTTIVTSDGTSCLLNLSGSINATLENISFVYGNSTGPGGAISSFSTGTLFINDCVFQNDRASNAFNIMGGVNAAANGGAISASGPLLLLNSAFISNEAGNGLGISNGGSGGAISGTTVTVTNCVFANNLAGNTSGNHLGGNGGAISAISGLVQNSTFYNNISGMGGGSTFSGLGGAIYFSGTSLSGTTEVAINNTFWANSCSFVTSYNYNDIYAAGRYRAEYNSTGTNGSLADPGNIKNLGNIIGNPRFSNASNNDFSLLNNSPCINAGTLEGAPVTDIIGTARPQPAGNNNFDIGAYEYNGNMIQLSLPVGGEIYKPGDNIPIQWQAVNFPNVYGAGATQISIDASADNGSTWSNIAQVVNTGGYTWTAPSVPSSQYLVRVGFPNTSFPGNSNTLSTTFSVLQNIVYVSAAKGSDSSPNDGSAAYPFRTIKKGLSTVQAGGLVSVDTGTYAEHDLAWPALNNVTLAGAGNGLTTIDAQNISRCINVATGVNLSIEAITIQNGYISTDSNTGAGINLASGCALSLSKVNLLHNQAQTTIGNIIGTGGAVYSNSSTVIAQYCFFNGNFAFCAGGVAYGGTLNALNCIFQNNSAVQEGGVADHTTFNATNCVFSGNSVNGWGTIASSSPTWESINCLFYDNGATGNPLIDGSNIQIMNCTFYNNPETSLFAVESAKPANIINSILWKNGTQFFYGSSAAILQYCDISTIPLGGSTVSTIDCISLDPAFVSTNESSANFLQLSNLSPCIDMGTPQTLNGLTPPLTDIIGTSRALAANGLPDMGAYEYVMTGDKHVHNATKKTDYFTIKSALYDAGQGNVIVLDPTQFIEQVSVWPNVQDVVLESSGGSFDAAAITTLSKGRVFNLGTVDPSIRGTIEAITIKNGNAGGGNGGGALLPAGSGIVIKDCKLDGNAAQNGGGIFGGQVIGGVISNNSASTEGGGAYGAAISNCTLYNNKAVNGAGASSSTITYCTVSSNTATALGGGMNNGTATACIFQGNTAASGGGANNISPIDSCKFFANKAAQGSAVNLVTSSNSSIVNSVISGGTGSLIYNDDVAGILTINNSTVYGGNIVNTSGQVTVRNSIVWNGSLNQGSGLILKYYSDIQNATQSNTNNVFSIDPLFVNASSNNFRLMLNSPCINTADATTATGRDVDNFQRVNPDIGAYEYHPPLSILSPTNTDAFMAGSPVSIAWDPSDGFDISQNSIKIFVSYDNGVDWTSILSGGNNSGAYQWTIPANINSSSACLVSVEASTSTGKLYSALSGLFTVVGSIVYVSPSGSDSNSGTLSSPFQTIQYALNMVRATGEVRALSGTYTEHDITWPNKNNIVLHRATVTDLVTIDAQSNGRIMTIQGGVNATIEGVNFVNGAVSSSPTDGGAIDSTTTGTLHLYNCIFQNNVASNGFMDFWGDLYYAGNGGAIFASGPLVGTNLMFINNLAGNAYTASYSLSGGNGGALYSSSPVSLYNCVFSGNRAGAGHNNGIGGSGGAVFAPSGNIISCTFYENHAGGSSTGNMYAYGSGGALNFTNAGSVIENCVFWLNSAVKVYLGNVYDYSTSQINGDCAVTYSDLGPNGSIEATGNICTDPLFNNASNNDLSLTYLSPCVDAGTTLTYPLTDINGSTRPQNGIFDMGAYEYTGTVVATNTRLNKGYYTVKGALSDGSIQANDVITVSAGIINEHDIIWPNVNNITLRGAGSNETVISAEAIGRVINVPNTVSLSLESLTISNGLASMENGAGISLSTGCLLNLSNVNFIGNITSSIGGAYPPAGAINSVGAKVRAKSSLFLNNNSSDGGAAYGGTWEVVNCIFQNNWAAGVGGVMDTMTFTATDCVFSGNSVGGGGGISNGGNLYFTDCLFINNHAYSALSNGGSYQLFNCTFYGNSSPGGPIFGGSVYAVNSIFWNNTYLSAANMANIGAFSYCDLGGETLGSGVTTNDCFSADPQFVSSADQHLGTYSPCLMAGTIEAGVPSFDLDGNVRLLNSLRLPDLGAYEKTLNAPVIDKSSLMINGSSVGSYAYLPKRPVFSAIISDNYLSIKMISVEVQIGPNKYFAVPQALTSTTVMVIVTPEADLAGDSANISLIATNVFNLSDEFVKAFGIGGTTLSVSGTPRVVPNPIRPLKGIGATFIYDLSEDTEITLMLFDITGKKVWQQTFAAGENGGQMNENRVYWDGKNSFGQYVSNGVYLYILSADKKVLKKGQLAVTD